MYFKEFYFQIVEDSMALGKYLERPLQAICLRTLIAELHHYKDNHLLKGKNSREEYLFFCNEIAGRIEFIDYCFERYPELYRCVKEKIQFSTDYFQEVMENFERDKRDISKIICKKEVNKIIKIDGAMGDTHCRGKHVLKLTLDTGEQILYKPHSLRNEVIFSELLQWLARHTGISQKQYDVLSRETYGWSKIVEYRECKSQEEVQRFYQRLGVQLFLAYILNTRDLLCENLIAAGEYPVLIDLESLVSYTKEEKRSKVQAKIVEKLQESVLCTGILPVYHWDRSGEGIDVSAIGGEGKQRSPFRVPQVKSPETSDMFLGYTYPVMEETQNRVSLFGKKICPDQYMGEVLEGFEKAYQVVLDDKDEFRDMVVEELKLSKSRYIHADTQKYSMLLSASYHPSLLKSEEDRYRFFMDFYREENLTEEKRRIAEEEIHSMMQGDIPYFEYSVNDRNIWNGEGKKVGVYLKREPLENVQQKINRLTKKDLEKQKQYIKVAFTFMSKDPDVYHNGVYLARKKSSNQSFDIVKNVKKLVEEIISEAVWNEDKTEVGWEQLTVGQGNRFTWNIEPMNYYLYQGLAGMLLLFWKIKNMGRYRREAEKIYQILRKMFFRYTEEGEANLQNLCSRCTGMYEGEGSVAYIYLLLYQQSKEEIFLEYAKRHAAIVEGLLDQDEEYDLLSGNAGAAWVMMQLYDITRDDYFLDIAKKAVDLLSGTAEKQEEGIGWRVKEQPPMAGMAHGNSGVLMPVFALWEETGDKKYERMAEDIWKYENSLYDPKIQNWTDVRAKEIDVDKVGPVAWCHGAGGILLSRLTCYKMTEELKWKGRLREDIKKAYTKLNDYWLRDSWSLCHGICGNLWILEKADREFWRKETDRRKDLLPGEIQWLPQEKMNPGFMNGYGGVLYFLLMETNMAKETDK